MRSRQSQEILHGALPGQGRLEVQAAQQIPQKQLITLVVFNILHLLSLRIPPKSVSFNNKKHRTRNPAITLLSQCVPASSLNLMSWVGLNSMMGWIGR
jgi:hypothetical protein